MCIVVWTGAAMTALGLTWNIIIVEAYIAGISGFLNAAEIEGLVNLGYVIVVPGILLGGYAITFDSWSYAYRKRIITDIAPVGYNTYASMYNTYHTVESLGDAVGKVFELFTDDDDSAKVGLILIMVTLALFSGLLITAVGIWYFAARDEPIYKPSITQPAK